MSSTDVVLRGAPDACIGTLDAKSSGLQVMQLEMNQEVLDELLESARSGKPPQILFGRAPQLRYGDKTQVLESNLENLRHELYRSDRNGEYAFAGIINHTLAIPAADHITAGVDTALENLKNSLATLNQEKEARKVIVDSAPISSHRRNYSSSASLGIRNNFLKPSSTTNTPTRSLPSSPALGASNSPASNNRPTSAPQQDSAKMNALRLAILHVVAVEPIQIGPLARLIRCTPEEARPVVEKIGALGAEGYKLVDRAYKELQPWSFPYGTEQERKKAIDNAIRAYDRMRVEKEDPLWQKLLPKHERGKGTYLSRLKINAPSQPAVPTPALNLKKLEKKADAKKQAAGTAGGESEKKVKPKAPAVIRKVPKSTIYPSATSPEPVKKETKEPAKRVPKEPAKRETKSTARKAPVTSEGTKASAQKRKEEPKASAGPSKSPSKPTTTKPKTPSPLSASPPVNASDFEDNHPVHKALSAAASPAKPSPERPLKRKADDMAQKARKADQDRTPVNGFRPGTNSTPSSAERKRKAGDMDNHASDRADTPHKKRLLDPLNTTATSMASHSRSRSHSNADSHKDDTLTSPSSSSPTSPPMPLSYQQTIALSKKFRIYYDKYYKLHSQLSKSDQPPTEQQKAKLWRMHLMLKQMKEDIRIGSMGQH